MPIQDPLEMKETLDNVVHKLSLDDEYKAQFVRAFGSEEIDATKISLALEQFMKSIVSYQSKYDFYIEGKADFTESEKRGMELFFAEYNPAFPDKSGADCAHCHSGNNFDSQRYINNGLDEKPNQTDLGRELVTGNPADRAKFKVPSLRNIALTAPYMHDGRFSTLEEVIHHYNKGIKKSPTLDPALEYTTQTGLMLDEQDVQDLISFLNTLTDTHLVNNPMYANPHDR
ncbi:MAG: hypothetical protein Kow0075_12020 [Salibacteraceae bacterium]